MNPSQKIVLLLGSNGVGKSHICRILEKNHLGKYFSIEEFFMEKYGSLVSFTRHRSEAYQAFETLIRSTPQD